MKIHNLKTINPYFQDIWEDNKTFEVRKDDRGFQFGDKVVLKEYNPEFGKYSGRMIAAYIGYILDNPDFCKEGYVTFQLTFIRKIGV